MKKILFAVAAVLTFGFTNAQEREKGTIELTPQIGYASANYYGEANFDNTVLNTVSFGVGGDYFFNDRWSLRSGLLYQTMGVDSGSYNEKLNYITIPVNANWHFGSTRKWNLNFGPSVGMLLSAKSTNGDFKDLVKGSQMGFNYGIGYKLQINEKFSILFDFQGMTGLSKIAKDDTSKLKNAYQSINIGGVFKL